MKKLFHNPYFMISAVYVMAHSFLLILSGCWWDDWTFMTHNVNYVAVVAEQSGRPEWKLLVPFCWSLPNNGRILIYFLYLGISLFVYRMLKETELFSEEDSLMIALLFSVVPVNDARLLISNFAYTVGLFFFYLAFMLFVPWNKTEKSTRKIIYRILLLALFYISFILNSVLVYYYIVIAYLFLYKLKTSAEENWIRKISKVILDILLHYIDFCILPIVYYILNKLLFPVSGVFIERNVVSSSGLLSSLDWMPWSVLKVFTDIYEQYKSCLGLLCIIAMAVVLALTYLARKDLEDHPLPDCLKYLFYGMSILVLALFPYIVVRNDVIDTIGVKGRDAILVPLGFALIIYGFLVLVKGKYRKYLMGIFLALSVICCNLLYLEWQKDTYYQLALEDKLDDLVIKENDTFFLTELKETKIEGQRYYSLNANAYNVYGEKTRLFLPKVSNLHLLQSEKAMDEAKELLDHAYLFEDYEPEDYCLDAVLDYDCELSNEEVWKLKYLELMDQDSFRKQISALGDLHIYVVDDDFTAILLDAYDSNSLREDKDVLELLYEYLN